MPHVPVFQHAIGKWRPRWRGRIHAVAVAVTLPAGIILTLVTPSGLPRVAVFVYVASLLALFSTSASYHLFTRTQRSQRTMRQLDHAMVYVLIAHLHSGLFARTATQCRCRIFNWDLVRRVSWHRAENYMAGSQSFGRNVFDYWLGGADCFAVGTSSRWFYKLVIIRTWRHRVYGRCDFVLFATPTTSTTCVWLPRGVACLHCCCCCSAICRRWRSDCPRRLTPSETIVAGIKNARP